MYCYSLMMEKTLFTTGDNNSVTAVRVHDGQILWSKTLTNVGYSLAEDPERGILYVGGGFEELWMVAADSARFVATT